MTGALSGLVLGPEAAAKETSDTDLVALAAQGDEAAFAALFDAHKRRVYSLCLRMTGDATEAEDLCQEAFLQVFRKISTFRGESAFATWLHRVVANVVLMRLRKKGLQEMPLNETGCFQEEPIEHEYGDDDRRLAGTVDRISLERAVRQLPQGYRTVFVLHDVEGWEHREIAQVLNRSVGYSKSQLHRARLKLRALLRSEAGSSISVASGASASVKNPRHKSLVRTATREVDAKSEELLHESIAL